jgi:hypothetical protein
MDISASFREGLECFLGFAVWRIQLERILSADALGIILQQRASSRALDSLRVLAGTFFLRYSSISWDLPLLSCGVGAIFGCVGVFGPLVFLLYRFSFVCAMKNPHVEQYQHWKKIIETKRS